jgi:hypothetical protein
MTATRMSATGQEWAENYARYNSGTYCNQFMIVDYNLFVPGEALQPNTLWIIENIPGYVEMADVTPVLASQGYWPSYNVPYFPFIFNISGFLEYEITFGPTYSYSDCPRANIFRRNQASVHDLTTMKAMMRFNRFQTDAFSLQDACNGISARCDLNAAYACNNSAAVGCSYAAFGGLDCKITSNKMSPSRECAAVCGPTWESQPPFAVCSACLFFVFLI